MNKKILFRADGNSNIGLGHLYRLFALVEMYKDQFDFIFVTSEDSTTEVFPKDYPTSIIPKEISIFDEINWIYENYSPEDYIVILDGYQFIGIYQKTIKSFGYYLMYIDDLAKEHMYADLVVNHSPYFKKENYNAETYTKFFLGSEYALLRPSFLKTAKETRVVKKIDTAFVCFGGADAFDFTRKITLELLKCNYIQHINIILGGAYKHSEIHEIKLNNPTRMSIYKNVSEIEILRIMKESNVAFIPASTILYELLSVKIPVFTGYFVTNQVHFYESLFLTRSFFGLGNLLEFDFTQISKKLKLLNNQSIKNQIENQAKIIDGRQLIRYLQIFKKNQKNDK